MRSLASTLLRTLCKGSYSRAHGNVHILTTSAGTVCSTHLVLSQNTHATLTSNVVALCVRVCACVCYVLTIEIGLFHCFSSVQDLLPLSRVQFAQHETNASVPRKTGEPKPDSTCAEQLRLITWKGLVEYDHSYCSENGPNGRWWNETREDLSMGTVFSLILLEKDI